MRIDISFDDGDILDQHAADLLMKYGFTCTFYLPSFVLPGLEDMYRKLITKDFRIGGHTVTHPQDMKLLDDEQLCYEILQNKKDLEETFGRRMTQFCYPRGRQDQRVRGYVRAAGYSEARTTIIGYTSIPTDLMEMPTTVHIFQRQEYAQVPLFQYARDKFDEAMKKGLHGYFSLWGHSKEIQNNSLWHDFEGILKYMRMRLDQKAK